MSVDATGAFPHLVLVWLMELVISWSHWTSEWELPPVSLSLFQEVIGADFELSLCSRPHTHTHTHTYGISYSTCLSLFLFNVCVCERESLECFFFRFQSLSQFTWPHSSLLRNKARILSFPPSVHIPAVRLQVFRSFPQTKQTSVSLRQFGSRRSCTAIFGSPPKLFWHSLILCKTRTTNKCFKSLLMMTFPWAAKKQDPRLKGCCLGFVQLLSSTTQKQTNWFVETF